jgi:hypothetical protein
LRNAVLSTLAAPRPRAGNRPAARRIESKVSKVAKKARAVVEDAGEAFSPAQSALYGRIAAGTPIEAISDAKAI